MKITNETLVNALTQYAPKPIQQMLKQRTEALHAVREASQTVKQIDFSLADRLNLAEQYSDIQHAVEMRRKHMVKLAQLEG